MIDSTLNEIERWLGREFSAFFNLFDPFWGWLFYGLVIIALCLLLGWAFSSLRPVAGTVILSAVAFLVGFWKGEKNRGRRPQR